MKRYKWLILLFGIFLVGGCKAQETKKEETETKQEAPILKTQEFELELTNGQKQRQTVVYKGDQLQKIVLKNSIEVTPEITEAIAEVGLEETLRLMRESMAQEPAYLELDGISGLTYVLEIGPDNQFYLTFTLDVTSLDTAKLGQSQMFQGSGMADVKLLTSEQYLKRLESYGAKPENLEN